MKTNEEEIACEVLRRVLGADFTDRDDGTRDRQPDGLFTLPDGREGALEVSFLGTSDAFEVESLTAGGDWTVPGANWAWHIDVGPTVNVRELRRNLNDLVLTCERLGVTSVEAVRYPDDQRPSFKWAYGEHVHLLGIPASSRHGAVEVTPTGSGGAVSDDLEALPEWLATELATPRLQGKIEKLKRTGRPELHLFLPVHDSGMPFYLFSELTFGRSVPSTPPTGAEPLSGVWVMSRWSSPVLLWDARTGWTREDCLD